MEVSDEFDVMLTAFPDGGTTPPHWDASVRRILSSVTATTFLKTAETLKVGVEWAHLLPVDPLINLAADLLGTEKLSLLRACVPESRALPGDWAPAALIRSVAHELTADRFASMLASSSEEAPVVIESLMKRLPPVDDAIARIAALDWMLAERVRLLLVARGWLDALDAEESR